MGVGPKLKPQIREQMSGLDLHVFTLKFLVHKNFKKRASKVAHNQPRPFYFTDQHTTQPTAQNWFFILCNLGTRYLFSYLCHAHDCLEKTLKIIKINWRHFNYCLCCPSGQSDPNDQNNPNSPNDPETKSCTTRSHSASLGIFTGYFLLVKLHCVEV